MVCRGPRRCPIVCLAPDPSRTRALRLGWLDEYLGPGYYNRQNANDDARHVYPHLNNDRMIVWLNELAGEDTAERVLAPRLRGGDAAKRGALKANQLAG
ncbi:hypothetical protein PMN64_30565 [Bradyrhizobium sp. UFLA01-814]|uniref:hypothetical protein n=1 Tax=Bradyrhizobium sp. UFLA01-814 TaxID=3023480 RepID=UPI00398A9F22